MPRIKIGPFFGGITDQKGSGKGTEFETLQHFDVFTDPYVLTPIRSLEQDEGENKSLLIQEFLYGSDGKLYGRGTTGSELALYEKATVTTASWSTTTNGSPSVASEAIPGCFIEYKSEFFGVRSGGVVWKYNPSTDTFTDTVGTLASSSSIGQGLLANDDNLYIPYGNRLAKYDGSTFTPTALLLPSHLTTRCIENKGNYVAVACSGNGITTNSIMYLWDAINADPTERVDWGLEILYVIGNIGGTIVGVSLTEGSSLSFAQSLVIKAWAGGEKATTIRTIPLGSNGYSILKNKFVVGDTMYFTLNTNNDAEDLKGVWAIRQNEITGEWSVSQEIKMINDTKITTLENTYRVSDYWFVAHSTDGSIDHTNDAETYAGTSVAVSTIFTDEDGSTQNETVSVIALCDKLPSGASFTVQLKQDDGSYETAISESTTGAVRSEAIKLASGSAFTKWTKLQVKITSTGGAKVRRVFLDYNRGINSAVRK